jgi:hypothetical protein
MSLKEQRQKLRQELAELDLEESNRNWAAAQLSVYSRSEKERLLRYLKDWRKEQPGHDADCNCGECD